MRLALVSFGFLVLFVEGCALDPGALDPVVCAVNGDCAPDQECVAKACARRRCTADVDCGGAQELACLTGGCYAVRCADGCGAGFQCGTDEYCWPRTCSPSREGPVGDPSCSDGIDNDCDGLTDEEDPSCVACQRDADCDDGKQCNGRETCAEGHCVPGIAIACTQPGTSCRQSICDDSAPAASPCVIVPADDGSPCDDGDNCTEADRCQGGACAGSPKGCDDDVACTDDSCDPATGACVNAPNDAHCLAPEVCRPSCFGGVRGCGEPPQALTLTCATPVHAAEGGSCTVDLAGAAGQGACLSCVARGSAIVPFFSDFDDGTGACALDGWGFSATSACDDTDSTWCLAAPGPLPGLPALMADRQHCAAGEWALTRRLDASQLGETFLCFNAAASAADSGDFVRLEVDAAGAGAWVQLFQDAGGPLPPESGDDQWLRTCVQLPAAAAHQAEVGLRLTLHSGATGHRVFVDDVHALSFSAACLTDTALFQNRFDGCLKPGWTVNGAPGCPGFGGDAVEAQAGSFMLTRAVDTRGVRGDLLLRFDVATSGATTAEAVGVAISTTAGVWQTVFAQNGPLRSDPQFTSFLVNLSAHDPRVQDHPSLGIRVSATSSGTGRLVDVDNVRLVALAGTCTPPGVTVGAPVDRGGGRYDLATAATVAQPVQIQCTWDDSATLTDSAAVELVP
ncbi:MAG TPA: hypothetical protein VGQ83_19140 [Polyangia bacterium]